MDNKVEKPKRTVFIRLRLTPQEQQIIEQFNAMNQTNVSEHVRSALDFYAKNNHPELSALT